MEKIVENGLVVFVSKRGIIYKNFNVRRGLISARKLSQKALLQLSSSSLNPEAAAEGPASSTQPRPGGGGDGVGGGGRSNRAGTTFETLDPNVVIILVVLLFALVCAAFLNSIMRCVMRRSNRAEDPPQESQAVQGLDEKALAVLPILSFRATQIEVVKDGSPAECPICLSEFAENKKVRLLPKCNHVFHIDCIDMWLLSHVSCPVCRDSIVDDPKLPSSAIVVLEEPSNSSPAPSNIRAELLRESGSSSSSALVIQTSALGGIASSSSVSQDMMAGSRRHGSGVRASVSSMFAVENVRSLFTSSVGHAAASSSASTS